MKLTPHNNPPQNKRPSKEKTKAPSAGAAKRHDPARTAANKARNIEKTRQQAEWHAKNREQHVPHTTARAARRAEEQKAKQLLEAMHRLADEQRRAALHMTPREQMIAIGVIRPRNEAEGVLKPRNEAKGGTHDAASA